MLGRQVFHMTGGLFLLGKQKRGDKTNTTECDYPPADYPFHLFILRTASGVTTITGTTIIDISALFPVLFIHFVLAMSVAVETTKFRIISRGPMTILAAAPLSGMLAGRDRKTGVVIGERGGSPAEHGVAIFAMNSKTDLTMNRVSGLSKFHPMAGVTITANSGEPPFCFADMTGIAIQFSMCPNDWKGGVGMHSIDVPGNPIPAGMTNIALGI